MAVNINYICQYVLWGFSLKSEGGAKFNQRM